MPNDDFDMVEARSRTPMVGIVFLGTVVTYALIALAVVIF